jgi:hypothetical protein
MVLGTNIWPILLGFFGAWIITQVEYDFWHRKQTNIDASARFPRRAYLSIALFLLSASFLSAVMLGDEEHSVNGFQRWREYEGFLTAMTPAAVAGALIGWFLIAIKNPRRDKIFEKTKDKYLEADQRIGPVVLEWFHTHGRHLSAFQSQFMSKTGKFLSWHDIKTRVEQGHLAFRHPHRGLDGVPVLTIWDAEYGCIDPCFYLYDVSLEALGGSEGNAESEQEDAEIERLGGDIFFQSYAKDSRRQLRGITDNLKEYMKLYSTEEARYALPYRFKVCHPSMFWRRRFNRGKITTIQLVEQYQAGQAWLLYFPFGYKGYDLKAKCITRRKGLSLLGMSNEGFAQFDREIDGWTHDKPLALDGEVKLADVIQMHLELELDELVDAAVRRHNELLDAYSEASSDFGGTVSLYSDRTWFETGCEQERADGSRLIREFVSTNCPWSFSGDQLTT